MSLRLPTTRAKSSASCAARVARRTWRRRSSTPCRCAPLAPSSSPTRPPSSSWTAALRSCAPSARSRQQDALDLIPRCRTEERLAASHSDRQILAMERSLYGDGQYGHTALSGTPQYDCLRGEARWNVSASLGRHHSGPRVEGLSVHGGQPRDEPLPHFQAPHRRVGVLLDGYPGPGLCRTSPGEWLCSARRRENSLG